MSDQAKRNPQKRPKDRKHGTLLLDAAFEAQLPGELAPYYVAWAEHRPKPSRPSWAG